MSRDRWECATPLEEAAMPLPSRVARSLFEHRLALALASAVAFAASCASTAGDNGVPGGISGRDGSVGDDGGFPPLGEGGPGLACSPCDDFPPNPILDGNASQDAAHLFGPMEAGASSGGPCLVEPASGALFPQNWLRPRFLLAPGTSGQDLFEIRLHTPNEANDLVVYTSKTQWTMPKDMWTGLTNHAVGTPIVVSVRGVSSGGGSPALGSSGDFTIAPATADGAMVYWTTAAFDNNANNTNLQGFHVGDEGVTTALTTAQVQQQVRGGAIDGGNLPVGYAPVFCVGCHTSTPDGQYVAFTAQWPWPNALASIQSDGGVVGSVPPWLSQGAISNLSPNIGRVYAPPAVSEIMLGIQTFSKTHYQTGDRIVISSIGASWNSTSLTDPGMATGVVAQLAWFDLEWNSPGDAGLPITGLPTALPGAPSNGGWGIIDRMGDTNSAGAPNWSHDGQNIAYASTDIGVKDGRMNQGKSDVKLVPYNSRMGGAVTALEGASDPNYNEYYPAFSPDDSLIAFNRVTATQSMYNQPAAEVYVVAAAGAPQGPTRLKANDPAACSGKTSPGVQNTWPKWAPGPNTGKDGKIYNWIIFSSTRSPVASGKAQLYVSAVVTDPTTKAVATYPAIYLWNQDPTLNNLIPAWDNFAIPHGTQTVQ
jgi:hypothetical protein